MLRWIPPADRAWILGVALGVWVLYVVVGVLLVAESCGG